MVLHTRLIRRHRRHGRGFLHDRPFARIIGALFLPTPTVVKVRHGRFPRGAHRHDINPIFHGHCMALACVARHCFRRSFWTLIFGILSWTKSFGPLLKGDESVNSNTPETQNYDQ